MAAVGKLLRDKWANEARAEAHARSFARDYGTYAPVGEMWSKQSAKAALFKTHGWIATTLLRWQRPDGTMVPFDCGYNGDTLMAPLWKLQS